jgi:hypothetical protein
MIQEPYPTEIINQTPIVTTKKNRLAPSASNTVPTTGQPPSKPLDPESSPNLDLLDSVHASKPLQPGEVLDKPEDRVDVEAVGTSNKEAGNVGEVRRKVAEMSYNEEKGESGDLHVSQRAMDRSLLCLHRRAVD